MASLRPRTMSPRILIVIVDDAPEHAQMVVEML